MSLTKLSTFSEVIQNLKAHAASCFEHWLTEHCQSLPGVVPVDQLADSRYLSTDQMMWAGLAIFS